MGKHGFITLARGNSDNEIVQSSVSGDPGVLESKFFCEVLLRAHSTKVVYCKEVFVEVQILLFSLSTRAILLFLIVGSECEIARACFTCRFETFYTEANAKG